MGRNPPHSTAKALQFAVISVACGLAMAASAVAGAWVQSKFDNGRTTGQLPRASLDADAVVPAEYIRESVSTLAAKLGEVQARLIAIEGLGQRVAQAAGVTYTDPEIQLGLEQSLADAELSWADASATGWTAESLGRELDLMASALTVGSERLQMLDAVLTKRTGIKEALPSLAPVDQPYLSSSFGWRRHPITGRHTLHEGLDFAAPRGTPIVAASGGVVTEARYVPGYGKMVEINHGNGLVTRYAHASSISVKLGEVVSKGQQIARVGTTGRSTGPHLHYEVRIAGHPLDPTLFIAQTQSIVETVTELADAGTNNE